MLPIPDLLTIRIRVMFAKEEIGIANSCVSVWVTSLSMMRLCTNKPSEHVPCGIPSEPCGIKHPHRHTFDRDAYTNRI